MNKLLVLLVTVFLALLFAVNVNAALYDRGNGMVYDSDQDITWLIDFNYAATQYAESGGTLGDEDGMMTWAEATDWAQNLEYGGYSDWRLPAFNVAADQLNKTYSTSGSDRGYNVNTSHSEFAYLWYEILGNVPYYNPDGTKNWVSKRDRPLDIYPINTTADGVTFINYQWDQVFKVFGSL